MPESTVPRRPIHGLHPTCCPRYLYPSHPTGSGDSQKGHWSCPPFVLLFRLASATGKQKKSTVIKFNRRQANFEEVQRPPGATRKRIRRTRAPCFSAAALLAELAILFILGPIAGSACAPREPGAQPVTGVARAPRSIAIDTSTRPNPRVILGGEEGHTSNICCSRRPWKPTLNGCAGRQAQLGVSVLMDRLLFVTEKREGSKNVPR